MADLRLIVRALWHYRRLHAGLFLGAALAGALLTGALVVGDSADYTLRTFALLRLGGIHTAVDAGDRPFDQALADARSHEQQVTELYAEIGRLTTQLNWLKKKSGLQLE